MAGHILRAVLIVAAAVAAGLVHGFTGGMQMPEKPAATVPKRVTQQELDTQREQLESAEPVRTGGDLDLGDLPEVTENQSSEPAEEETTGAPDISEELMNVYDWFQSGEAVFVDSRTREEYTASHIPGAIFLPFEEFLNGPPDILFAFPPDQMFIIYCGGGDCHASESVGAKMKQNGYENVVVFSEGYPAWEAAGFETASGEPMF